MKRYIFLLIILLIFISALTSCYPGNAAYYESRFDELDISGRVSDAAFSIDKGYISPHLYKELDVIIQDLGSINTHGDPTIENINTSYTSCIKMLKASAELRAEDDERYSSYLNMAKKEYQTATYTLDLAKKNERDILTNE